MHYELNDDAVAKVTGGRFTFDERTRICTVDGVGSYGYKEGALDFVIELKTDEPDLSDYEIVKRAKSTGFLWNL